MGWGGGEKFWGRNTEARARSLIFINRNFSGVVACARARVIISRMNNEKATELQKYTADIEVSAEVERCLRVVIAAETTVAVARQVIAKACAQRVDRMMMGERNGNAGT